MRGKQKDAYHARIKKSHLDPSAGLNIIPGNQIMHLAMAVAILTVEPGIQSENEECNQQVTAYQDLLWLMFWVHLICFSLTALNLVSYQLPAQFHDIFNFLGCITMPIYQGAILYVFDF